MKRVAALCLLLMGCASGLVVDNGGTRKVSYTRHAKPDVDHMEVVYVFVDPSFSKPQQEAIAAGLKEWNYAMNGYETLVAVPGTDGRLDQIVSANVGIIVQDDEPGSAVDAVMDDGVLAVTQMGYRDNGIVHMLPGRIGSRDFKAIFMHEMGHALGADHVPFADSLMYYSYSEGAHCIDLDSARAVATVHRWDFESMNWCSR